MKSDSIEILRGWTRVDRLRLPESLIVKVVEPAGEGERLAWRCLDLDGEREATLPVQCRLPGGDAPAFDRRSGRLVFAGEKGVIGFSLGSREERLITAIDSSREYVRRLWLSDEPSARVAYLLAEHASAAAAPPHSLHIAGLDAGDARLVARLKGLPSSMEIDWARDIALAFTQNESAPRRREIQEIDLATGRISELGTTPLMHFVLTPGGDRLAWLGHASGIVQTSTDAKEAVVAEFGGNPAPSPDGARLAFGVDDHQLWLKDSRDPRPVEIVAMPSAWGRHAGDRIVWCPCSKHLAVNMAGRDGRGATLTVLDCERREVLLREDLRVLGTQGDRVWVPAETAASFF